MPESPLSEQTAFAEPLRISTETAKSKLEDLKAYAKPTYSGYRVAAVVITKAGDAVPGVNLEFDRHRSVCAEQAAITLARHQGATGLQELYVTDWPCGVCRQFLWELASPELIIHNATNGEQRTLGALLPDAFELGSKTDFWTSQLAPQNSPEWHALDANTLMQRLLMSSYAPLTRTRGAALILTEGGGRYGGSLLENAAFTPSLSPMHTALVSLLASRKSPDENVFTSIKAIYYGEPRHAALSYRDHAKSIAKALAPSAHFDIISD